MNESEWNYLRKSSQCASWRDTPFLILGATGECKEKWYASDSFTKPSDYDQFEFKELCDQMGMGEVRLGKICSILSMIVGESSLSYQISNRNLRNPVFCLRA